MSLELRPKAVEDFHARSFLQSAFWGDFKSAFGWKPMRYSVAGSFGSGDMQVLIRRLPAGQSFAYLPHGPEIEIAESDRSSLLSALSEALRPQLPASCIFIRYDPPWIALEDKAPRTHQGKVGSSATYLAADLCSVEEIRPKVGPPLLRAMSDVQVPDTVLIDLSPDEDAMLASMKPKWRYNIKLAERKGVRVEECGAEGVSEFYELYRTTSLRDRIALHPEEYYRKLVSLAEDLARAGEAKVPIVRLWIARHEGKALASIITLFLGDCATYLYGASSDEKRDLMPAYALQWAAMRGAKAWGCKVYDLFGIPPVEDPAHPMAGLYRFKTGFGGKIAHRAGSWDYPLRPLAYSAYRLAENARSWWFKKYRKRAGTRR